MTTKPIEERRIKEHPLYQSVIKNPETVLYYNCKKNSTVCSLRTTITVTDGQTGKLIGLVNLESQGVAYRNPTDVPDDHIGKRVALWRSLENIRYIGDMK